MTAVAQPSFTTGELAPSLYARVDLARYYTALKTCRNWIVRPYGGVLNRPGFRFVAEVSDSTKFTRLLPFEFSSSQSYVLEFNEYLMRIIKDGGLVLNPSGPSVGLPVEVVSPYPSSALNRINYTQSADVLTACHTGYPPQQISRTDHHLWAFVDFPNEGGPFRDINIDETLRVSSNGVDGTVTITASGDIFNADLVGRKMYIEQSPDSTKKKWEVNKAIAINTIVRAGSNYYQAITSGTTGTVRPDHLEGVSSDGDPGVVWQYLHSGYGIIEISDFISATEINATVINRLPDQVVTTAISAAITSAVSYTTGGSGRVRVTASAHGFTDGSSVDIASVVGMTDLNGTWVIDVENANTFTLPLVTVQIYTSGGTATLSMEAQSTYKWAFESWGGDRGYPAATVYYQQRQVFGGSPEEPQTTWMSRSQGYYDFGQSIPLLDDDAINFKLVAEKYAEIRHYIRMKSLIALTSEGAWLITKEQGNLIPVADPQEQGGASFVKPLKVGKSAVYVEERGGAIRSLGYEFNSDSYEGKDLITTGSHLVFAKEIVDWTYQKVPFRCVWIVLDDGSLIAMTYMPDQEVVGWHRHDTDGLFESVCCISEGNEDVLYAVVKRNINGVEKRYIERMESRYPTDQKDYFFVDSGLTYDGRNAGGGVTFTLSGGTDWDYQETLTFTTNAPFFTGASDVGDAVMLYDATGEVVRLTITEFVSTSVVKVLSHRTVPAEFRNVATVGFDLARNTFSGLAHLEGKTVAVLADGNAEAQAVVTSGAITLAYPATVVHVGLPIEADFETLDINVQGQSLQDKVKQVRSVTLLVEDTRGLQAGPDANNLLDVNPLSSGEYDNPIELETGVIRANIITSWTDGGRVLIRQSNPLPSTILAAIPEVTVGGA